MMQPIENLKPCICGGTRRARKHGNHDHDALIVVCKKCGLSASGKNERELHREWNSLIDQMGGPSSWTAFINKDKEAEE